MGAVLEDIYEICANDMNLAGHASSQMKRSLKKLGVSPQKIKNAAVAMYEAEINACIHAGGGYAKVSIYDDKVIVLIKDDGPGIPDVPLAMTAGYSTATSEIHQMGFGAGMGLPNIQRNADDLKITTKVGEGTEVLITVLF